MPTRCIWYEKILKVSALGMALAFLLAPAAGEGGSKGEAIDGALIWSLVLATDAVGAELTEIETALLEASLSLSVTWIVG